MKQADTTNAYVISKDYYSFFVFEIFYVPHIHIGYVQAAFGRLSNKCMNNKLTKMVCDHVKFSDIISIVVHSFRGFVEHPANL